MTTQSMALAGIGLVHVARPSFSVPLFKTSSGQLFCQRTDASGLVFGFEPVATPPEKWLAEAPSLEISIGQSALCAFWTGKTALVATKAKLAVALEVFFDSLVSRAPFCALETAQFLESRQLYTEALTGIRELIASQPVLLSQIQDKTPEGSTSHLMACLEEPDGEPFEYLLEILESTPSAQSHLSRRLRKSRLQPSDGVQAGLTKLCLHAQARGWPTSFWPILAEYQ